MILGIAITYIVNKIIVNKVSHNEISIGIAGRYTTENLPDEILNKISDGLTFIDEEQNAQPSLAENWETPDNGKTWIFHLRDNIYWHDGEKLTSDDISYNFEDVSIERPDDKTITFILKEPFAPFPTIVSKPIFKRGLLGTDLWKVKNINFSENAISDLKIANNGDQVTYKFYPTEQRTKVAYKLGEIDEMLNLFDPSPFNEWDNSETITVINTDQVVTLFYNTSDDLLSDKTTRQALTYAINKDELSLDRAISPISKNSWAFNPTIKRYDFDTDRSKEIIDEITKNSGKPSIKLVSAPALLSTAEIIKEDWEKAGLEVSLQVSAIIPTEFQAFLAIFDLPEDPDQYSIWHSTQTDTNISAYTNPRIDKLLEDGRTENDQQERKRIYLDFQRFLLEDSPAAFLYYPKTYSVKRK
ncbi:hypothetical protein JXA63_00660 [Candidatus Woesebacteria bacterium]|nr:hypothetical protein [Candidatus Woesebacteria bacterium]